MTFICVLLLKHFLARPVVVLINFLMKLMDIVLAFLLWGI